MDDNGHQNGNGKPAEEFVGAEGPERTVSGLTPLHDARLESLAVRRGWINARWPTKTPKKKLVEGIRERGDITLQERVAIAAFELLDGSERAKGIGAKIAVAMEAQNQADEHKATPDLHLHAHKNLDAAPDSKVQRLSSLAEEFEQVAGQDLLEE